MARVRSIRAAAVAASLGLLVGSQSPRRGRAVAVAGAYPPGITVNLLTFNGPQVAEPLKRRAPDFEAATGHPRQRHRRPVPGHLHQGDPGRVDRQQRLRRLRLQPAVVRRLRDAGLPRGPDRPHRRRPEHPVGRHRAVLPRLQRVVRRQDLRHPARWRLPHGVLPQGPARRDGIAAPKTWEDYLAVAEKYNGQDLNEDGTPDYGSCIAKKVGGQSYWWLIDFVAPLLQSQGTEQGAFFDTTTMEPLFNNDAAKLALQTYKKTRRLRTAGRDQHSTWAPSAACSRPAAAH